MADLLRIQEEAKDRGFDSAVFYLSAPKGVFEARWMDAYFGFFSIPSEGDGFMSASGLDKSIEGFWEKSKAEDHNKENFDPIRKLFAELGKHEFGETEDDEEPT